MSITDGEGYIVAECRPQSIHGVRGVGMSRLQFGLEFQINSSRSGGATLSSPVCFVSVGRTQADVRPLGVATMETSWYVETTDYARREALCAYLDLTFEQLEALERMREGGPLFFKLDLRVLVHSRQRGLQRGDEQSWFEASLSTWPKVLEQIGYSETLLLGLELPVQGVPAELHGAASQLREAHRDLIAGRFDGTVARVRLAMDTIDTVLGFSNRAQVLQQFTGSNTSREHMSKRSRADFVRIAVRHYTHLAHHVSDSGAPETFSRHDAQFALAAAAAAIWDAVTAFRKNPEP
jgi:hypothetical protein